jgi:hypothetical protein
MGGTYSMYERHKMCIKILVVKPEAKRRFGRPRHRWENIKLDLGEVGWAIVYWIYLYQNRVQWQTLVNTVMNLLAT